MRKFLLHSLFWIGYWLVYAYTYNRYDDDLSKYLIAEGMQMPVRMASTYLGFYVLDRWSKSGWWALMGVAVAILGGGMANRLLKLLYIVPAYFPEASIQYWDLNRMLVDIFDCALTAGVALSIRLYFRQQESLRREARLEKEKTAAELLALKNQLQPHFLFNTINNLYVLARRQSPQTAPVALQLANLLRFVLYETRKENIAIEQEVKILQDYIALEQLRFDTDRLRVQAQFELDDPQQPILPLLLLPLVENAFKHGVSEDRRDAWVNLTVRLSRKKLSVQIDNSFQEKTADNNQGIGLTNLQRQLELRYPGNSQLEISVQSDKKTAEKFFAARLTIDLSPK